MVNLDYKEMFIYFITGNYFSREKCNLYMIRSRWFSLVV